SDTARPVAASAAAAVSPIRNGVGKIGSIPPVISTSPARSSGQPAIGKSVGRASLVMVRVPPFLVWRVPLSGRQANAGATQPSELERAALIISTDDSDAQERRAEARAELNSAQNGCAVDT